MPRYKDDDLHDDRKERVRRLIWRQPGLTGAELAKATHSIKSLDREDILADLIEVGSIRVETQKTKGRPVKLYFPPVESQQTKQEAKGGPPRPEWINDPNWSIWKVRDEDGVVMSMADYIMLYEELPPESDIIRE
jgi:hypothetical protein